MSNTKRFTIFILAVVLALSCLGLFGFVATTARADTDRTVDIYAINDFHGAVSRMPQVAAYLAKRKSEGAIVINSGDMFQGSMESNSNFGKLLSECMDEVGFDAFTYGNHEFDWGLDNLRELARNSATPFLGANIYNWNANTRQWGEFADDLAREYVVKELDNGLKVGIIGVIGKDQITSISSQLVQTIGFKDPADIIPDLSEKLRNEKGCDVVVVSAHTGQDTFMGGGYWDITDDADAVFCAHTHRSERTEKSGVPFIQGGSYGSYVSHVKLSVDGNGNVTCDKYENISRLADVDETVYDTIQTKIDNSNAQISEQANQVLATLEGGYLNSNTAVPRLVCHAIAEFATSQGHSIDLVMVNGARSSLQAGDVTYSNLYEAIPFDNVVYVARVSGTDILNEAKYKDNSIWRVSGEPIENSNDTYYTIAVIDYLLYHQNSNRFYNYFPSAFSRDVTAPVALTKQGETMYNYRLITRDFLLSKGTIDASIYLDDDNVRTDKSMLTESVDLPINDGDSTGGESNDTIGFLREHWFIIVVAVVLVAIVLVVVIVVVVVVVVVVRAKRKKS